MGVARLCEGSASGVRAEGRGSPRGDGNSGGREKVESRFHIGRVALAAQSEEEGAAAAKDPLKKFKLEDYDNEECMDC